jgi:hypothetical protein
MSFSPRDYDGESPESEEKKRREEQELAAFEAEEREAREEAFRETPSCELDCYEALIHTDGCRAFNLMTAALDDWRRAGTPKGYARIAPGIAVRVGGGKRRRA